MAIVAHVSNVAHGPLVKKIAAFKRFAGAVIIVKSFKTVNTEINFPPIENICNYKYRNVKFIRKEIHVNRPKGLKT